MIFCTPQIDTVRIPSGKLNKKVIEVLPLTFLVRKLRIAWIGKCDKSEGRGTGTPVAVVISKFSLVMLNDKLPNSGATLSGTFGKLTCKSCFFEVLLAGFGEATRGLAGFCSIF